MLRTHKLIVLSLAAFAAGILTVSHAQPAAPAAKPAAPAVAAVAPKPAPTEPQKIEIAGIKNAYRVSDRIYSGSEPEGDAAFEALKQLGITTIVSVDGAKPDVATAKKHGLEYVHDYFGYGGVPKGAQEVLAKVVREKKGPIFIHCHHGMHRGPAAAAIAWCLDSGADAAKREAFLKAAGTDPEYAGLYRDVKDFDPEKVRDANPKLLESQKGESLHNAMAQLGDDWDVIKTAHEGMWLDPVEKPEDAPTARALLVMQNFKESGRAHGAKFDAQFVKWMKEAEDGSQKLHDALAKKDLTAADAAFAAVKTDCRQCHKAYRKK